MLLAMLVSMPSCLGDELVVCATVVSVKLQSFALYVLLLHYVMQVHHIVAL